MTDIEYAWKIVMETHGTSGYYMAAQFDFYMMALRRTVGALMRELKTTPIGLIGLAQCGNPSPERPGFFAKIEEYCGIYGADVDALDKILRFGYEPQESPNTPANGEEE